MPLINLLYYSVVSCRFQIHLCIFACAIIREFTREVVTKFLPAQFPWFWCKCLLRNLINLKIFNLTKIHRSSRKIFPAHYPCRNAGLNLTLVMGSANGFVFQIINSLIESWRVRLTWLDCKRPKEVTEQNEYSLNK